LSYGGTQKRKGGTIASPFGYVFRPAPAPSS